MLFSQGEKNTLEKMQSGLVRLKVIPIVNQVEGVMLIEDEVLEGWRVD
jgi:hypothetical protein